jgi:hypothetical protein
VSGSHAWSSRPLRSVSTLVEVTMPAAQARSRRRRASSSTTGICGARRGRRARHGCASRAGRPPRGRQIRVRGPAVARWRALGFDGALVGEASCGQGTRRPPRWRSSRRAPGPSGQRRAAAFVNRRRTSRRLAAVARREASG